MMKNQAKVYISPLKVNVRMLLKLERIRVNQLKFFLMEKIMLTISN